MSSASKPHRTTAASPQFPAYNRIREIWSAVRFLFSKALMIFITIFLGVFSTIIVANRPAVLGFGTAEPQVEANIELQIDRYIRFQQNSFLSNLSTEDTARLREELREEAGLNLPYLPRHLIWTFKALTFDWGEITQTTVKSLFGQQRNINIRGIVLQYLPNTLLIVGAGNLLVFLIGIPLSLYLARNYGNAVDRLISLFSPLSSVPSWVVGVLLISIFAVELRWLPVSGMYDQIPPETTIGYVPIVLRHMILPVSSIVISLLFQLVYTWRTYFVIYSEEDYVDLAKAKGLPVSILQKKYILRPTLPYVITSFALILVGFWQMTMALEVVFQWPGIGWLYIKQGLPNYWGESMYPGELLIAIGIVVVFAYLLGLVAFILDIVYVLIDPRVHLLIPENTVQLRLKNSAADWKISLQQWRQNRDIAARLKKQRQVPAPETPILEQMKKAIRQTSITIGSWIKFFLQEVRRYPSAIFGLTLILFLVIGSITAMVVYPYEKIGSSWNTERLSGKAQTPRLARPEWFNMFRQEKFLSVAKFDETNQNVLRTDEVIENGWTQTNITYLIDYNYDGFPQEMYLYFDSVFMEKRPFVSLTWVTPDGRKFDLKNISIESSATYKFENSINAKRFVAQNENWQKWFNFGQIDTTPEFYVLLADPNMDIPYSVKGTYQLQISGLLFEPDSELNTELVLLGQVYGLAGTDYLRRDLIVPLLWGMPFALFFGLTGAFVTTILAMLLAATGVWFGGWVDNLLQRLTEANMILPVLAMSVLAYALLGLDLWVILGVIILLNVFGTPTKTFRSAFLQIKEAPYIEAARAYGAGNTRIIINYLVPRIMPILIPQLVTLIPGFVFLEATLGLFNIKSTYPTWGRIIYQGLTNGALYGSRFWVLEPIALLLLTGLAFSFLGIALERILNPRLLDK
jgi:peptide/nickel transport system permease protein